MRILVASPVCFGGFYSGFDFFEVFVSMDALILGTRWA